MFQIISDHMQQYDEPEVQLVNWKFRTEFLFNKYDSLFPV